MRVNLRESVDVVLELWIEQSFVGGEKVISIQLSDAWAVDCAARENNAISIMMRLCILETLFWNEDVLRKEMEKFRFTLPYCSTRRVVDVKSLCLRGARPLQS